MTRTDNGDDDLASIYCDPRIYPTPEGICGYYPSKRKLVPWDLKICNTLQHFCDVVATVSRSDWRTSPVRANLHHVDGPVIEGTAEYPNVFVLGGVIALIRQILPEGPTGCHGGGLFDEAVELFNQQVADQDHAKWCRAHLAAFNRELGEAVPHVQGESGRTLINHYLYGLGFIHADKQEKVIACKQMIDRFGVDNASMALNHLLHALINFATRVVYVMLFDMNSWLSSDESLVRPERVQLVQLWRQRREAHRTGDGV